MFETIGISLRSGIHTPSVFFFFQYGSIHIPTNKVDVILLVYLLDKRKTTL